MTTDTTLLGYTCPDETPYPSDYGPNFVCLAEDPCTDSGTGLWTFQLCEPNTVTFSTYVPHRSLPDTGTEGLLLPSAGLCLSVGLLLAVVARKRHRKRYVVAEGISLPPYTVWLVLDTRHGNAVHSEWRNKQAAKNRAAVLNANIPSLADSKGWKA